MVLESPWSCQTWEASRYIALSLLVLSPALALLALWASPETGWDKLPMMAGLGLGAALSSGATALLGRWAAGVVEVSADGVVSIRRPSSSHAVAKAEIDAIVVCPRIVRSTLGLDFGYTQSIWEVWALHGDRTQSLPTSRDQVLEQLAAERQMTKLFESAGHVRASGFARRLAEILDRKVVDLD